MDISKLDKQALTAALQNAGRAPSSELLTEILKGAKTTKPILLTLFRQFLAQDLNSLPFDDPHRQAGVVTGRLLIEMRATEALPILGEHYRQIWGDDVTADELDREPAHFGPIAIQIFDAIVRMNTLGKWHNGKAIAITILTDIALLFPETSAQIKAALRSTLPQLNTKGGISAPRDDMWGDIAIALAKLQDKESHKQIIAMIRQGVTDPGIITRERYERFYSGEQKPKQPAPFNILKRYETHQAFEQMMANLINNPVPEPPAHSQDLVTKAKQAEAKKRGAKETVGRNAPCPCASGKKYKNCCGK